jgi:hypothetical protein
MNLKGVTFEFHESSYGLLGDTGILEQIAHARAVVRPQMKGAADVAASVSTSRR